MGECQFTNVPVSFLTKKINEGCSLSVNKASTTPWGRYIALATAFLHRDMFSGIHEKLFGYVDHTVDEVLSVTAFDDDND